MMVKNDFTGSSFSLIVAQLLLLFSWKFSEGLWLYIISISVVLHDPVIKTRRINIDRVKRIKLDLQEMMSIYSRAVRWPEVVRLALWSGGSKEADFSSAAVMS